MTDFAAIRLRAAHTLPYMTVQIMSLHPVETPGVPTMAVDKYGRCYYLHECMHLALRHFKRCKTLCGESPEQWQLQVWNLAADAAVNDILGRCVDLPEKIPPVTPKVLNLPPNGSAEKYYRILLENLRPIRCDVLFPDPRNGWCGSASDGVVKPWEAASPEQPGAPLGLTEHEMESIIRQTAKAIVEHHEKGRGIVPGGLLRMAREIICPRTNPIEEFAAKCRYALAAVPGFGDYTYRRPKRRMPAGLDVVLPSHVRPVPQITLIVDTSGSMGNNELGLALGVVAQATRKYHGVRVLAGDAEVQAARRVFGPEQVELIGGGGTNMGQLIEAAVEEQPRPNVIFVITDGETEWCQQPDGIRVVACLTHESSRWPVPDWIEKVVVA